MNVKNYLLAAACLAVINFTCPYPVDVFNRTNGKVLVTAWMAGEGVCEPRNIALHPGASKTLQTGGGCCVKRIEATKFSGPKIMAQPARYSSTPPTTGSGMTCAGISVTVLDAGDGITVGYNQK